MDLDPRLVRPARPDELGEPRSDRVAARVGRHDQDVARLDRMIGEQSVGDALKASAQKANELRKK